MLQKKLEPVIQVSSALKKIVEENITYADYLRGLIYEHLKYYQEGSLEIICQKIEKYL